MLFAYWFRAAISVLLFALSIYQFVDGEIGNGIFILLIALVVLVTVWLNEMMIFTFLAVRKGDFAKARKRLDMMNKPEWLIAFQRAYWYYLDGMVKSQSGELTKAETSFKRAIKLGLYMSHDKAMAKLSLAGIAASKRRKREALNWLNEAKKDDDKKMLADQIKMMKQQLSRI
jgi:uncharacterized protein HemY